MERLSTELLDLIFRQLDRSTQKSIRLVCRTLEAVATPLLFKEFHTACFACLLHELVSVTASRLAKHVTKIVLHRDWVPSIGSRNLWEGRTSWVEGQGIVNRDREPHSQRARSLSGQLKTAGDWKCFKRVLGEQRLWLQFCREDILFNALAALSSLTDISIVRRRWREDEKLFLPSPPRLLRKLRIDPEDWRFIRSSHPNSRKEVCQAAMQAVLQVVAARRHAQSGIRPITNLSLDLELLGDDLLADFSIAEELRSLDDWKCTFDSLNALHIHWEVGCFDAPLGLGIRTPFETILAKMLSSASQLETLSLSCKNWTRAYTPSKKDSFDYRLDIFGRSDPVHYPRLRNLSLKLDAAADDLAAFLERHSTTLQSLRIEDAHVVDVPGLLRTIPAVLKLKQVYLQDLMSNDGFVPSLQSGTDAEHDNMKAMKEFLLARTAVFPEAAIKLTSGAGFFPESETSESVGISSDDHDLLFA